MWIIRMSLDLYGDKFSPNEFLKELTKEIFIFTSNEAGDFKFSNKKSTYEFGSISILCPPKYGLNDELQEYVNWYFDFLSKNTTLLNKYGVTEINMFTDVFHVGGQLNLEIFSRDQLKIVGQYGIALPLSYYKLAKNEILELLHETNLSKDKITAFINQE